MYDLCSVFSWHVSSNSAFRDIIENAWCHLNFNVSAYIDTRNEHTCSVQVAWDLLRQLSSSFFACFKTFTSSTDYEIIMRWESDSIVPHHVLTSQDPAAQCASCMPSLATFSWSLAESLSFSSWSLLTSLKPKYNLSLSYHVLNLLLISSNSPVAMVPAWVWSIAAHGSKAQRDPTSPPMWDHLDWVW